MSHDYVFALPWPPSINTYWATYQNRRITSKKGREYRSEVIEIMKSKKLFGENVSGDIAVHITLMPKANFRYDVDNFNKAIFDALTHSEFWRDDCQVVRLTIEKGEKITSGRALIKITKLN